MAGVVCPICLDKLLVLEINQNSQEEIPSSSSTSPPSPQTQAPQNLQVVTQCGHIYHKQCLTNWINKENKTQCPSCRANIDLNKIIPIYPQFDQTNVENSQESTSGFTFGPLRKSIVGNLESAQKSASTLEESAKFLIKKHLHIPTTIKTKLNPMERILEILSRQPNLKFPFENDIINLHESITAVDSDLEKYSKVIKLLTGVPKDKKAQAEYVNSLRKLNKLTYEKKSLINTLEKKISHLKPEYVLRLMCAEINYLSGVVIQATKQDTLIKDEAQIIFSEIKNVKETLEDSAEKFNCL